MSFFRRSKGLKSITLGNSCLFSPKINYELHRASLLSSFFPFLSSPAVAVALRNQKVAISGGSDGHVTQVSEAVEFPELSELTLCFEVERIAQKQVRRRHKSLLQ